MKYVPHDPHDIQRQFLRNLMHDAWDAATEATGRHGGRRLEYLPFTLTSAWAATKANPAARITADLMLDFS